MSFKVSQKGRVFFVEDTAQGKILSKFDSKEMAKDYADSLAREQKEYFYNVPSRMSIKSDDVGIYDK